MDSDNLPKLLYHYTSMEGLIGILNESALWASKIHYLNDASELTEPLSIATNLLKTLDSKKNDKEQKQLILSMLYDIDVQEKTNICVASFCVNGNLLSQWRAYGVPGSVYSIGFRVNNLTNTIIKHNFELYKCIYLDQKGYAERIKNFITKYIEEHKEKSRSDDFMFEFVKLAACMKHDCFKEENEYRIVSKQPMSYQNKKFNFRPGKSTVIPYYSIPLDLCSTIEKIIIGPCQHSDLAQNAIAGLAYKYGLYDKKDNLINIDVDVSDIPYRYF